MCVCAGNNACFCVRWQAERDRQRAERLERMRKAHKSAVSAKHVVKELSSSLVRDAEGSSDELFDRLLTSMEPLQDAALQRACCASCFVRLCAYVLKCMCVSV